MAIFIKPFANKRPRMFAIPQISKRNVFLDFASFLRFFDFLVCFLVSFISFDCKLSTFAMKLLLRKT